MIFNALKTFSVVFFCIFAIPIFSIFSQTKFSNFSKIKTKTNLSYIVHSKKIIHKLKTTKT